MIENYQESDVVEGRVTKVVTFGAFVEILPGVEGLVQISELAQRHVENPREVVSQGDAVNVLILEVDADRRRLSLSLKRVEEGAEPLPRADGAESVHVTPKLDLSEDVFPAGAEAPEAELEAEAEAEVEPEAEVESAEPEAEASPQPEAADEDFAPVEADAEPTGDEADETDEADEADEAAPTAAAEPEADETR